MNAVDSSSGIVTPKQSVHPISREVPAQPTILMVEHALGGGVQKHVRDLVRMFNRQARLMVMTPVPGGLVRINHAITGVPSPLYFDVKRELIAVRQFLRGCGLSRVHYHHLIQLPWEISQLAVDLDVPYDFTAHDYFSLCPQITLTSEKFRYCGEPAEAGCNRCLAIRPTPQGESIESWRSRFRQFIEGAARVFVPSPSVADRMTKHFPEANLVVAPHPEESVSENLREPQWRFKGAGALKVLVLGALNPTKGPDLLEKCALDASERGLPLEFHLLGSAYRALKANPESALFYHGPYRDEDLGQLITALSPHIVWFPAQWPETYSYTLSAAIHQSLPVAAPNFGAFHDRLSGRPLSWLVPWDTEAPAWNDLFVSLRKNVPEDCDFVALRPVQSGVFLYESDYLVRGVRVSSGAGMSGQTLRTYTRSWRLNKEFAIGYLMFLAQRVLRCVYKLPGVRRVTTSLVPEHRVQLFRRRLGKY